MFHPILAVLLFIGFPKDVDSGPIPEATKELKQDLFAKALTYIESNPETLEELLTEDYAVQGGDMMLSTDRNAVKSMWPTLEIPYVISPDLESRTDDILSAMEMVSEHTCVSFHKRTSETNYLLFQSSKGQDHTINDIDVRVVNDGKRTLEQGEWLCCASYVGFIGGEQPLFVGPPCIMGNIVHEILHALGFHHEHTRKDREQYISILPNNIMKGMERNFKMQEGETFNISYDVTSIMHYGSGVFSSNGLPTIVPHGDVKKMGQRAQMTKTDIERVRHLYNCDGTDKEPKKESGGGEKEEDANVHAFLHNVESASRTMSKGPVSANKPEDHTFTAAHLSALLHHLNAATRGQNDTSGEEV